MAPCGGPVPRAAADCGCTPLAQGGCNGTTWLAGTWRYTQSPMGCLTRTPVGTQIPDGVYTHPEVTMRDGHVVAIRSGAAAVATLPALCAPAGSTAAPGSTPVLSADQCNLTHLVGGRLETKVYIETEGAITVEGCGTQGNPFRFNAVIPGFPTGLDFEGVGIEFINGVAQTFQQPVMNVTADPGTGLTAAWNPLTATITLEAASGSAAARLPAVVCDSSADPTNGLVVGTPDTTYTFRLPNTATVVYTITTSGIGAATINAMLSGLYEVYAGAVSLGYISYTRCAYVAP